MQRDKPGFFSDWGRHGFRAAWLKRFSSLRVEGQLVRYDALASWPRDRLEWLLEASIGEWQYLTMCWAFEVMVLQSRDLHGCLQFALKSLESCKETQAVEAMTWLLRYDDVFPDQYLMSTEHGLWGDYLIGKVYADRAQALRGTDKEGLKRNKALAIHFLGRARQQAAAEPASPEVALDAATAATIAASAAAAYEAAAYLQYKGTRTTAFIE